MSELESLARSVPIIIGIDIALKSSALIALAFLARNIISRSPVVRSAIWNALLAGLILLPFAAAALPQWRIACLPARSETPSLILSPNAPIVPTETPQVSVESVSLEPSRTIPVVITEIDSRLPRPISEIPRSSTPMIAKFNTSFFTVVIYIGVAFMLMTRLGFSLAAVSRLTRRAVPVSEPRWVSALETCRKRLSIRRNVSLLSSRHVSVPVAVGWLFPAVILPEAMAREGESRLVEPVLLHELSHVKRGDYAWNLLARILQVIYWPNPLVRVVGPLIRDDRERACDDVCIYLLGDRHIYQSTLLEVASGQVRRPSPALGMAMARPSKLAGRLAWIARSRGASRCLPRPAARYAIVASLAAAASMLASIHLTRAQTSKTEPPAVKAEQTKGRIFTLKVVDATTGKPVKAMVALSVGFEHSLQFTDDQGRLEIRHSTGGLDNSIHADISAEGLALQRHFWQDKPNAPMPDEATVKLLPGEKLGGIVRDEQGKPIAGATVFVWSHNYKPRDPHELMYDLRSTTGPDGRWETQSAPEITGEILGICLKHPDFLSDTNYYTTKAPSIADLRAGKSVSVMNKGTVVSGRVVDSKGRPVAGARVLASENEQLLYDFERTPTATSDAEGRFRLPQVKPGPLFLFVRAKGPGPGYEKMQVEGDTAAKVIRLGKPATFQGRVFDTSGNPMKGVLVSADSWRGCRLLNVFLETNAEGRFTWEDGPDEEVYFNFIKEGFRTLMLQRLEPSRQDMPFVLHRELHIHGALRDKETKKRIRDPQIKIEIGRIEPGQEEPKWNESEPIITSFYDIQVDAEKPVQYQFRIHCKGYGPFLTRTFRHDEGTVEYDIALTKLAPVSQKDLNGKVIEPSGKALAGAQVFLDAEESRSNRFEIRDGKFANPELEGVVTTDAEGRFKIPSDQIPTDGTGNVVVVHQRYFGEMTLKALLESGSTLKVRPWGRIEGKLRIGKKPAANATIQQSGNIGRSDTTKDSTLTSSTKTDSEGNFKFDQVVPGDIMVNGVPDENQAPMRPTPRDWIEVKEGEVAMVQLGGTGRPVALTVFVPPDFHVKRNATTYSIHTKLAAPPVPKEVLEKGQAVYRRWIEEWRTTPEGKAIRRKQVYLEGSGIGEDGIIRVDDINPGEYVFDMNLNDQNGKRLRYSMPFVMPPIPGDWSDEPLDLGVIKPLVDLPPLKPGDAALPFEAKSSEGKPITLEQFRGKTVLLTSWTSWLEPFKVGDLPQLRDIFEKHGKNPNFVMLSLNSDSEIKLADEFRKANSFPGIHGWIQGDYGSKFYNDYLRLGQIPAIFLIGPDGKFLAVRLRGRGISEAVDKALGLPR